MTNPESTADDLRPTITCGALTFYKPTKGPVIITVLLVGLCFALGIWQIQRLAWKEGLISELTQAQSQTRISAENLPDNLATLVESNFHSIALQGTFIHKQELHIVGRSINGEPGFSVYTPFRIADDGRMVLVNRGWVPQSKKSLSNRPEDAQFDGLTWVNGFISVPQGGSPFLPDHDVKGNLWFWPDIARINAESGMNLPPFTIEAVNENPTPGVLPLPRSGYEVELRNDHFNYALMWFSLSIAGLIIFFIYHLKPMRNEGTKS